MLIKTPRLSIDSNDMEKFDVRNLKLQQLPPKSKIVRQKKKNPEMLNI